MVMNKYITKNPAILGGKPIIKGTRMSVEVILEFLAGGMEIKEMLKEFPFLKREHIQAAIRYAASAVEKKRAKTNLQAIPHEIHRRR